MRLAFAALMLGGCASSLPPELADPLGHVRHIEGESAQVAVPDLLAEAALHADPARACEILRRAAQGGERAALPRLVSCVFAQGEVARAHAIADIYEVEGPSRTVIETVAQVSAGEAADEVGLNAALELSPADPHLWNLLGAEYERQGRDAEAVDAYVEAKRLGG